MSNPLKLYNLFPRYYNNFSEWANIFIHIKELGFDSVYINPIHYPGFSGSLYAPKNYYALNTAFIDTEDSLPPFEQLSSIIQKAHDIGLKVIMDLVINHSAKDNPLTIEHSSWYVHDKNNNLVCPGAWEEGQWISWRDLAQFDHSESQDKENFWHYLLDLIIYYNNIGFDGFRADAAYQLPSELWLWLIKNAKLHNSQLIFIAESLGCRIEDSLKLAHCGFDFLCTSAKWWNFEDSWFIEQYNTLAPLIKTISFPESHDTIRLSTEYQDINIIKRLLTFTGLISSSWMIISGTEYAWKNKPDVIHTKPSDKESCTYDFTSFIIKINNLRDQYPILNQEGSLTIHTHNAQNKLLILEKKISHSNQSIYFIINKTLEVQNLLIDTIENFSKDAQFVEIFSSYNLADPLSITELALESGECKVFLYEKKQ